MADGYETYLKIIQEQNGKILTSMGKTDMALVQGQDEFKAIRADLKKLTGNGNYKEGLLYKFDELAKEVQKLVLNERNCLGRNPHIYIERIEKKMDIKIKELSDLQDASQKNAILASGIRLGIEEEKRKRRAQMKPVEKWLDIFREAPKRSAIAILSLLLTFILIGALMFVVNKSNLNDKQKQIATQTLHRVQKAVTNGGGE